MDYSSPLPTSAPVGLDDPVTIVPEQRGDWYVGSVAVHRSRMDRIDANLTDRIDRWSSMQLRKTYFIYNESRQEYFQRIAGSKAPASGIPAAPVEQSLSKLEVQKVSHAAYLIIKDRLNPNRDDTLIEKFTAHLESIIKSSHETHDLFYALIQVLSECPIDQNSNPTHMRIAFILLDYSYHSERLSRDEILALQSDIVRYMKALITQNPQSCSNSVLCMLLRSIRELLVSHSSLHDKIYWLVELERNGKDINSLLADILETNTSFYVRLAASDCIISVTLWILVESDFEKVYPIVFQRAKMALTNLMENESSANVFNLIKSYLDSIDDSSKLNSRYEVLILLSKFLRQPIVSGISNETAATTLAKLHNWIKKRTEGSHHSSHFTLPAASRPINYISYISEIATHEHQSMIDWIHWGLYPLLLTSKVESTQLKLLKDQFKLSPLQKMEIYQELNKNPRFNIWTLKKFLEIPFWFQISDNKTTHLFVSTLLFFIENSLYILSARKDISMAFKLLQAIAANIHLKTQEVVNSVACTISRLLNILLDELNSRNWSSEILKLTQMFITALLSSDFTYDMNNFTASLNGILKHEIDSLDYENLTQILDTVTLLINFCQLKPFDMNSQSLSTTVKNFHFRLSNSDHANESDELSLLKAVHAFNVYLFQNMEEEIAVLCQSFKSSQSSPIMRLFCVNMLGEFLVNYDHFKLNEETVNTILSHLAISSVDSDRDVALCSFHLILNFCKISLSNSGSTSYRPHLSRLYSCGILFSLYATCGNVSLIDTISAQASLELLRFVRHIIHTNFPHSEEDLKAFLSASEQSQITPKTTEFVTETVPAHSREIDHQMSNDQKVHIIEELFQGYENPPTQIMIQSLVQRNEESKNPEFIYSKKSVPLNDLCRFLIGDEYSEHITSPTRHNDLLHELMDTVEDILTVESSPDNKHQNDIQMDCY